MEMVSSPCTFTEVSKVFAETLMALIGPEAIAVQMEATQADGSMITNNTDLEVWEYHIESEVDRDLSIPATEREAIITARRGQVCSSSVLWRLSAIAASRALTIPRTSGKPSKYRWRCCAFPCW